MAAARGPEVMIIGGGQLYEQTMEHADRMVLTLVDCAPPADTWFPEWREEDWRRVSERNERADERNRFDYRVIELTRRRVHDEISPAPETPAGPPA